MNERSKVGGPSGTAEPLTDNPYAERVVRFERLAEAASARSRLVSNLRGASFGVAVVALLLRTVGGHVSAGPVAVAGVLSFVLLVVWHARVIAAEDDAVRMTRVNLDARSRATGTWQTLPDDGARFLVDSHPYATDLDLFGPGSIYQRVNVAHTRYGQAALARFLTETAPPAQIALRQEAARALAPKLEERQRLEASSIAVVEPIPYGHSEARRAKQAPVEPPDPEPLLSWAEGKPWLAQRPLIVAAAHVLPVITLAAAAGAHFLNWHAASWTVPLILSIVVGSSARAEADRVFTAVSSTRGAFLRYGPMFEVLEGLDLPSALLGELRRGLLASAVTPSAAMRRFERIVGWFDLRYSGLVHPFANAFLLWDIHCLLRLEAWQKQAGREARRWFEALGEVEALSSFAGLAHDEPSLTWPEIEPGPARFEAEGLGHALIPPGKRVVNDVSLPAPGRALLITGSNMSGKSTLLRSMGVAAVLAFAGAPVAARRLRLSPLLVRTSLKIADSLARGVSHFYAEVARLKGVVDATAGGAAVLFLLDEILHGTNSRERQIGARWVLAELLRHGAIGAVSTHDAGLCRLPDALMEAVSQYHFRENVEDGRMTFDYRLRPGPVEGGNALRLMQLVGLPVPLQESQPAGEATSHE